MDLLEGLLTRRSKREYSGDVISDDDIIEIIRAGMYAPSANNRRPWHFIIVNERSILDNIMRVHPYSAMLRKASHAIIVCGDDRLKSSHLYYPYDCSAATQNLLLATHALGYGAVWLGVEPRPERIKAISDIFGLPPYIHPVSIVSIGIPVETRSEVPDRFEPEKIRRNHW
jgi:nitroreductase